MRTIHFPPDETIHWRQVLVPTEAIVCADGSVYNPGYVGDMCYWCVTFSGGEFLFRKDPQSLFLNEAEDVETGEQVLIYVPAIKVTDETKWNESDPNDHNL